MIPDYLDFIKEKYDIIDDLTPQKDNGHKTYLAFIASNKECERIILKELDAKRTSLFEKLQNINSPHIANVLSIHKLPAESTSENNPDSIAVIEYAGDVSLSENVKQNGTLPEKTALSICIQICDALYQLHSSDIIHRDIKPENIMICNADDMTVKLVDFGGAKIEDHSASHSNHTSDKKIYADTTVTGTIGYQAPETISSRASNVSDIYSLGCVLNFMLTGSEPAFAHYDGNVSIRYIIRKCTNEDPSMRLRNVCQLKRLCQRNLHSMAIDRIPILRDIPGYRSHTLWKSIIATIYYIMISYELIVLFRLYPIKNFIITGLFWFVIPMIAFGNIGYISEYFPERIRYNNRINILLHVIVFMICLFVPLLIY